MAKLIAFFSRADENYVSGVLKNLDVGNTEEAAHIIQKFTQADLFKIEPKVPYSSDYNACIDEAKKDLQANIRPELVALPDNIDSYSEIYLGYPNYWGTMPMAVFTFLDHFDFTGKTLHPFCTHEGSGLGKSVKDIQTCCPTAIVDKGLAIHGSRVKESEKSIKEWCTL